MSRFIDLTGNKYGKLTVIKRVENTNSGKPRWLCNCDCKSGKETIVPSANLKNGTSTSCGCNRKGINKKFNRYYFDGDFIKGVLNDGYEFLVDLSSYELIKEYSWHKHQDGYLRTCVGKYENGKNHYFLMHKLILGDVNNDFEVDHINGKPNDNRLNNLRVIQHSNNMKNCKLYHTNSSGHKGVYCSKSGSKWKACIGLNGEQIHIGTFVNKQDAIDARKKFEKDLYKEFSRAEPFLHNGMR